MPVLQRFFWLLLGVIFFVILAPVSRVQADLGFAQKYPVAGDNLRSGQIISYDPAGYKLSSEAYDKTIIGIITDDPAVELSYSDTTGTWAVLNSGTADVEVNTESGPIKKGDMITSSSTPGVGMKAVKSGFILGVAQADFSSDNPQTVGKVPVDLSVKFAYGDDSPQSEKIASRLLDVLRLSSIATLERPTEVFKYVLSALIMIATLIFSFFSFARTARNGTEALGRNPLASTHIFFGMIMNILLSIVILGAGLGAAYFIVRL